MHPQASIVVPLFLNAGSGGEEEQSQIFAEFHENVRLRPELALGLLGPGRQPHRASGDE